MEDLERSTKTALIKSQRSAIRFNFAKFIVFVVVLILVLFFFYLQARDLSHDIKTDNASNLSAIQTKIENHNNDTKRYVCNLLIQLGLLKPEQFDDCFKGDLKFNTGKQPVSISQPAPSNLTPNSSLPNQDSTKTNNQSNPNQNSNNNSSDSNADKGLASTLLDGLKDGFKAIVNDVKGIKL